jgi:Ca2+-binding RTX toxin-like protein
MGKSLLFDPSPKWWQRLVIIASTLAIMGEIAQDLQFRHRAAIAGRAARPSKALLAGGGLRLVGGAGADILTGGAGDDVLVGRGAADTLIGGAGKNIFAYESLSDSPISAPDRILDWHAGDRIDLHAIDGAGAPGAQRLHLGATLARAGDIVVTYDNEHGRTVVDLYESPGGAPAGRILIDGIQALRTDDFILASNSASFVRDGARA